MMELPVQINSRITSKNQVTIPKTVRNFLKVKPSDSIKWTINTNGQISVTKGTAELWDMVSKQEKEYGNLSTPEIDWGTDIESDDFD
ncbi:type II toxin-antitoxin system PrlF family antitoxin [Limosilactobacillus albertensis]|uniref:Type II toxin-antitoxin system PrlF family antitoxin n=1 Tax=Limosilactobacillus albertensis TaxID=2759752 RepID=A0A839H0M3_9LACO|nr:type II toxin-antitoxin system PrlF family antitoxin [Limosilactobacillus albertensis]MBB1124135.1 type II toxin-antitoxin system PrlF family antitoxin [Limosilactobacillus albertensis]MCD7122077.1 type II toxin-antitoxin system PrlF family antitoxin [Limosilactobacillus albertensis]